MNSEEMLALATLCEQASGPDRELDALIRRAVYAPVTAYVEQSAINGAWCIYNGIEHRSGRPRLWEGPGRMMEFTASLDAAMTLCEPHWWVNMSAPLSPEAYGYSREESRQPRAGMECIGQPYSQCAAAATMALAVCAMALKARARAQAPEQLKGEGR